MLKGCWVFVLPAFLATSPKVVRTRLLVQLLLQLRGASQEQTLAIAQATTFSFDWVVWSGNKLVRNPETNKCRDLLRQLPPNTERNKHYKALTLYNPRTSAVHFRQTLERTPSSPKLLQDEAKAHLVRGRKK